MSGRGGPPLPVVFLVGAAALWGTAGTATKFALRGFGPLTLLTIELASAAAVMWIILLSTGYRPPPSWRHVALLGLFEPALAYLGDTLGLARTSASNGAVITGSESVFVVILAAVLLKERISRLTAGAVAVATVGLFVLSRGDPLTGPGIGDLLVLGGALSAAAYSIVARAGADEDALAITAHQFAIAELIVVPLAAARWLTGAESLPADVPMRYWVAALGVGIAGFGLSFLIYNRAIVTVEAGAAGVVLNLIPAFGLVSAVLWLHEHLTTHRLVGIALVGLSVATFATVEIRATIRIRAEVDPVLPRPIPTG